MEDKRQLANEELGETFGLGVLALKPEEPKNFVELPKPEDISQGQSGTVMNNFNVNVNVSGKSNTDAKRVASEAIKQALPTTNEKPEEVKKNSQKSSTTNSRGNSRDEPVLKNYSKEEEDKKAPFIDISESIAPTIAALDLAGLGMFITGDMTEYEYSSSRHKEENAQAKRAYSILKNLIHNSLQYQNTIEISPQSAIEHSTVMQEIAGQRHFETVNYLNVEKNINENYSTVNNLAAQKERQDRMMTIDNNRAIQTMAQNRQERPSREQKDIQEATTIVTKGGAGAPQIHSQAPRKLQHLNPTPSTIGAFTSEMNSPPWWRTILG